MTYQPHQSEDVTLKTALENCRLFAARHRKEEWARTILRFCDEGGATGTPLRAEPNCQRCGLPQSECDFQRDFPDPEPLF